MMCSSEDVFLVVFVKVENVRCKVFLRCCSSTASRCTLTSFKPRSPAEQLRERLSIAAAN